MTNPTPDLSQKAEAALRMVREAPELSFDTETSGVDWKRNFPIGWVICPNPKESLYIPTRHGGGGNLPDPNGTDHTPSDAEASYTPHSWEIELAKAFDDRNRIGVGPTIGHNLKFDAHFSANVGVMLGRNLVCTMNTQALINEYTRSFSLDKMAKDYEITAKFGNELYDHIYNQFGGPAGRDAMGNYWRLSGSDPLAVEYAEGDGVTTIELYYKQLEKIEQQSLHQIYELECALIWTLFRVERRGIKIDEGYLDELIAGIEQQVKEAFEILPDGFNPRSPIQVKKYVEQFATDWPTTEKGNPSFTEKWLKTFDEGKHIIAVRQMSNLNNSFAGPLKETHVFNGRVHTSLNQNKSDDYGTISGRLSSSMPNLQQVPKHKKDLAKLIRKAFIPDEGMLICEGDYSQMEPRMFAHYSGEPSLIDGYNADPPRDVHSVVAEMFNADRNTTAKRMNMGMFTGMFPKAFAGHMGVPLSEATDLWNQWFRNFPKIKTFTG